MNEWSPCEEAPYGETGDWSMAERLCSEDIEDRNVVTRDKDVAHGLTRAPSPYASVSITSEAQ